MAGAHGFISKGAYMYDEVYRIPLLMKAAGETTPRRVASPVHLMDVTATCLHVMAGSEQIEMGQQKLHGQSLLGFADSETRWPRTVHYAQYHGDWNGHYSSRMVTDGKRKLVWNLSDLGEFYNLEDDPHELKNRFYDPDVRAERDEYFSMLIQEAKRLRDGHINKFLPENEDTLWDCGNGPLAITEQG